MDKIELLKIGLYFIAGLLAWQPDLPIKKRIQPAVACILIIVLSALKEGK